MPGPICIITSNGVMICEDHSYYEHYYTRDGKPQGSRISGARVPASFKARVNKLMDMASAEDAPFSIVPRPKALKKKK